MVDRLISNIPSIPLRKFVSALVLIVGALVLVGAGWSLRGIEDKADAAHDIQVADRAAIKVEEQMVRDLKLLLSCQQVPEPKK